MAGRRPGIFGYNPSNGRRFSVGTSLLQIRFPESDSVVQHDMNVRLTLYGLVAAVLVVSWLSTCVIYRAAEIGELVGPIEAREFQELTVIAVGSGGGYENPERMGPSIAVGWSSQILLVDAGRGVAEALRTAKIPIAQPQILLFSSLLPENTVGLDDLLLTGMRAPRTQPLRVIGPTGTRELVDGLLAAHGAGIAAEVRSLGLPPEGATIEVLEVEDGWSEELDGLRITAGALSGGPLEALAWRFEWRARRVVVATTGWAPDALVEFARGAHLLVHEAVYLPNPDELEDAGVIADPERLRLEAGLHTSILDVGGLASRAGVPSLALVRMRPPPFFTVQVTSLVGKSYDGKVIIPDDGEEIEP
jgi:ribonuclease BN (tRNA processing enzyme)